MPPTLDLDASSSSPAQSTSDFSSPSISSTLNQKQPRQSAQAALSILINYYQIISALCEYFFFPLLFFFICLSFFLTLAYRNFTLPLSISSLIAAMRTASLVVGSGIGFQCMHNNLGEFKYERREERREERAKEGME
jgi:hypothetical protein